MQKGQDLILSNEKGINPPWEEISFPNLTHCCPWSCAGWEACPTIPESSVGWHACPNISEFSAGWETFPNVPGFSVG